MTRLTSTLPLDEYVPAAAKAWERLGREARVRLTERLKEHGVKMTPYMPMANNVLVLRLPAPPVATKTEGGIHIPETAQEEPEPLSEGVLVQAGCMARDVLRAHGILLGDLVQIGRFAGWEKEFKLDASARGNNKKILQMKEHDILGSFDLHDRLWGKDPTMRIVFDEDTEEHRVVPITEETAQ